MHPQRKPELRNYLVFMNTKVKGYILGAVAAATYGMNPLFTLPLYKEGMNPDSVLFFRYLFAIPILGIMLKARGRSFSLKRKEILPLVIKSINIWKPVLPQQYCLSILFWWH